MIGRTPEYLGKRIGPGEARMVVAYIVVSPLAILSLTALAVVTDSGLVGLTTNSGMHGFSEILFAYTSSFANNGQNFAGLTANSGFYNLTTALAMLIGRFGLAIPALAIAGALAAQTTRQRTVSTLPTTSPMFAAMLMGTILIVGALTFFPALVLGPVAEHLTMANQR
jgi:K+-transporting ATPase ATPase A chain